MTLRQRLLRRFDCFAAGVHQKDWDAYKADGTSRCRHCHRQLKEPPHRGGEIWQDSTDSDPTGSW